ncbi:hypothetical protein Taro_001468 [Colocasia esculenta]|uniref:Uncharacterized protein n=1 Tax=Colocasia esculenta TaxID=4460 RepID=A0A843TI09_COLES|nr:hypothetical protein [Colocasia esculenta]
MGFGSARPVFSGAGAMLGCRVNWKGKKVADRRKKSAAAAAAVSGGGVGGVPDAGFSGYKPPALSELQSQNRAKAFRFYPKKKFARFAPYAPRNTTSFIIQAKKAGGIASLVSPCPVTPAILPTPGSPPPRRTWWTWPRRSGALMGSRWCTHKRVRSTAQLYTRPLPTSQSLWSLPDDRNVLWSGYWCKNFTCLARVNATGKGFFKCADCFNLTHHEAPGRWMQVAYADPSTNQTSDFLIEQVLAIKLGQIRVGLDFSVGTGTFAAKQRRGGGGKQDQGTGVAAGRRW